MKIITPKQCSPMISESSTGIGRGRDRHPSRGRNVNTQAKQDTSSKDNLVTSHEVDEENSEPQKLQSYSESSTKAKTKIKKGRDRQHYNASQMSPTVALVVGAQTGETTVYLEQVADNQHQYQQGERTFQYSAEGTYGQTEWQEHPDATNENQAQTEAGNQNATSSEKTAGHLQQNSKKQILEFINVFKQVSVYHLPEQEQYIKVRTKLFNERKTCRDTLKNKINKITCSPNC